jgi:hypothetical protein
MPHGQVTKQTTPANQRPFVAHRAIFERTRFCHIRGALMSRHCSNGTLARRKRTSRGQRRFLAHADRQDLMGCPICGSIHAALIRTIIVNYQKQSTQCMWALTRSTAIHPCSPNVLVGITGTPMQWSAMRSCPMWPFRRRYRRPAMATDMTSAFRRKRQH